MITTILQMFHWPGPLRGLLLASLFVGIACDHCLSRNDRSDGMEHKQTASSARKQGELALQVTLRADRSSYRLGDEIRIDVLLTNTSQTPLYLYAELDRGESASLSIWLKDTVSGKDVSQDIISDAHVPPPNSKDDFIKLSPNHVYGVVLTYSLADLNVRKKGTYEIVAEYHSPIPSKMGLGLPIWGREKGAVPSNGVTITVGE